jgi:LacI family transcriptional regulator
MIGGQRPGSERASIREVAARAGVSAKTVSRVINNHRYVTADTRARVEAAIKALGFRPSIAARSLAGTRSGQVALLYDNHSPYYIHQIQEGCWSRCQQGDIRLLAQPIDVANVGAGDKVRGLIAETHVDGIILSSPVTDCPLVLAALEEQGIAFVRISPGTNHALTSSVFMDDAQAADDMTTHLINLGHRRIGFIIGHPDHMASDQRLFGYHRALDRAGVAYEPALVTQGQFDFDSGAAAAKLLLDQPQPPTAIFASNDDMAAGVLAVAHRRGIAVPADLSVAGFDDTTLARVVWPPLTTIRQPVRDLAFTATDILLRGDDAIEHQRLQHELIIRDSTAPPSAAVPVSNTQRRTITL